MSNIVGTVKGAQSLTGTIYPKGEDGKSPYIGENHTWMVYDHGKGEYVDSMVLARYSMVDSENLAAIANMQTYREALDPSKYEKGSLNEGGVNSDYRSESRLRSIGIDTSMYDQTIVSVNNHAGIVVYFFDDDGNCTDSSGWVSSCFIPAGSHYRMILTKNNKASENDVIPVSETLANFYFLNEYKVVKQTQKNAENIAELEDRVSETENEVEVLREKIGEGGGSTEKVLYVATDGDDSAAGSADAPLETFNKAIAKGATTIIAEPGVYRQTISASGLEKLTIRPDRSRSWINGTDKIVLSGGEYPMGLEDYTKADMFYAEYSASPDSRMYKVFTQELPIVDWENSDDVDGIYCYNVNAYIYGDDFSEKVDDGAAAIKLTPVLTIEECESSNNTFCYHAEGNSIIVHCKKYSDEKSLYIPKDEEVIASFENCGELVLEDIRTEYGYVHGINIQDCRDVTLTGCEANLCTNGEGFYLNHTNAKLSGCKAHKNFKNCFKIHENCHAELIDCYARGNSSGDGAYFGQGCRGAVVGGEYSYAPAPGIKINAGAEVNVYNAIMRGNWQGLSVTGETGNTDAKVIAMNNAIVDNSFEGMIVRDRTVVGLNHFEMNGSSDVETYGNGVYEELPGMVKDAVLYTPQQLTKKQKAQARENIGVSAGVEITDSTKVIIPETHFSAENGDGYEWDRMEGILFNMKTPLVIGETYTMTVNGVSYEAVATKHDGGVEIIHEVAEGKFVYLQYFPAYYGEWSDFNSCFYSDYWEWVSDGEDGVISPEPTTISLTQKKATPGDVVVVKSVDENGKPRELETCNLLTREQVIFPNTYLSKDSPEWDGGEGWWIIKLRQPLVSGATYIITVDGVEYTAVAETEDNTAYVDVPEVFLVYDTTDGLLRGVEFYGKESGTVGIKRQYDRPMLNPDYTDNNAVLYTPQDLTAKQKAQARANIGAVEKWFEIADITSTEEVNSFYVNKDKYGNPFVCKRIVASMVLPSALTSGGMGVYFGGCNGIWIAPGFMSNNARENLARTYDISVTPGFFTEFRVGVNVQQHFGSAAYWGARCGYGFTDLLKQFFVCRGNADELYPVGTQLKVWGLRA